MSLPIGLSIKDIEKICTHLLNKPEGVSTADAVAAFGRATKRQGRLTMCRRLGVVEKDDSGTVRITDRGRGAASPERKHRTRAYLGAISTFGAYTAVVKEALGREGSAMTSPEVSALWKDRFSSEASTTELNRREQANFLFGLLVEAGLGKKIVGVSGKSNQFAFDPTAARRFLEECERDRVEAHGGNSGEQDAGAAAKNPDLREAERSHAEATAEVRGGPEPAAAPTETHLREAAPEAAQDNVPAAGRIFVNRGGNEQLLDQISELMAFGGFETVAAPEHAPAAKTFDVMRSCGAGVILAGADGYRRQENGGEVRRIDERALLEIGAAAAVFGGNAVMIVEEGAALPSAMKGMRKCRYAGSEMDGRSIMALVRIFKEFVFD